jgi:hypothetical protein
MVTPESTADPNPTSRVSVQIDGFYEEKTAVSMSSDGLGKFVRAAMVSGLLATGALVVMAGPARAQDSTDGSTDGSSDGSSDGATDGATDGSVTTQAPETGATNDSNLPVTGAEAGTTLAIGGAAVAMALAGRRLYAARS